MRRIRLSTVILAFLLAVLASATGASAYDQETRYFTIRVLPPSDDGAHLFVTQTSEGLRLERYRSGDTAQMWAVAPEDYPAAPAVTGEAEGGWQFFEDCFTQFPCGFDGSATRPPLVRLVNRSSGRCIAIGATRAVPIECANASNNPTEAGWQRLEAFEAVSQLPGGNFTSFSTGKGSCLAANSDEEYADGMHVRAVECGENMNWAKLFTTNLVATVTCRTDWYWQLCFE